MKLNQHHHSKVKKNHLDKNAFSKKKNKKRLDQKSKRLNYIKYNFNYV